MTVIVKQTLLLLQVEADPVMEASDLAFLHFACNDESKVVGGLGFLSIPSPMLPFLPLLATPGSYVQALTSRIFSCLLSPRPDIQIWLVLSFLAQDLRILLLPR